MSRPIALLAALLTFAACAEETTLPGEHTGHVEDAEALCAAALDADECGQIETADGFCGAVWSAECTNDPYGAIDYRFDGCVATNYTCTQSTVWLMTDEGCRTFDGCYAPTDELASCDPAVECPND